MEIKTCSCCKQSKKNTKLQKINSRFFDLCSECIESLRWTQACLKSGTDLLVKKMPEKYQRVSKFSVSACE